MASDGEKITAFVYGGNRYRVVITTGGDEVGYECDCPQGMAARFCKHCVAVCLAQLEGEASGKSLSLNREDARGYLASLAREDLESLALEEAFRNGGFRERLSLRMARARGEKLDLSEYGGLLEFASQVTASAEESEPLLVVLSDVESSLGNLIEAGYAAEAASLLEAAPVLNNPRRTELSEKLIALLLSLHRRSCLRMGVAAEDLAARLLRWQLSLTTCAS